MSKIRFPYGISNFKTLVTDGFFYVDRTMFLEKMEQLDSTYHFFLRPRRFGKSLAVSIMEYYYGKEHKADFDTLFGKYYIGQHPTERANSYLVLKFDFSGIRTDELAMIIEGFNTKVKGNIIQSLLPYKDRITDDDIELIRTASSPNQALAAMLELVSEKLPNEKIFLLIDEYDHFTNEIIAFHFDNFQQIVSRNGVVRKFYEVIKEGTQRGIIDRVFITGVSPITLDSLTSGFNIGTNLSLDLDMHDFMGFREDEVQDLLGFAGVSGELLEKTLDDLRAWYNGYLFNQRAVHRLYNPDMVLYFSMEYGRYKRYPETLLDPNISSDYGKIRRMFKVGSEQDNLAVLEDILENGSVSAVITRQFSFEKQWTRDDFISLLFYMGLLTVRGATFTKLIFEIPNHVITELYYRYFQEVLFERSGLKSDDMLVIDRVIDLASDNNIKPLVEALEAVLQRLSNRDARHFDEKYVKAALMALLVPTGIYSVFSEYAIGQGYADIIMFRRPPILDPKFQFIFELKFLKKKDAGKLEAVAEEGRTQLRGYLAHPDIAQHKDMVGYLLVVVGHEVKITEVVN